MKKVVTLLMILIIFLFSCSKKEEERADWWYLEGTVYCDGDPAQDIQVKWGYGEHSQFYQMTWTDLIVITDEEGKYYAKHRPNETSQNVLNYHVSALNPYKNAWTDPEQKRNIIMSGLTAVENFYFISDK